MKVKQIFFEVEITEGDDVDSRWMPASEHKDRSTEGYYPGWKGRGRMA